MKNLCTFFHQQVISEAADNWKLLRQLLGEETIWMDGFDQKLNNPPASLDAEEISEEIDVSKSTNVMEGYSKDEKPLYEIYTRED